MKLSGVDVDISNQQRSHSLTLKRISEEAQLKGGSSGLSQYVRLGEFLMSHGSAQSLDFVSAWMSTLRNQQFAQLDQKRAVAGIGLKQINLRAWIQSWIATQAPLTLRHLLAQWSDEQISELRRVALTDDRFSRPLNQLSSTSSTTTAAASPKPQTPMTPSPMPDLSRLKPGDPIRYRPSARDEFSDATVVTVDAIANKLQVRWRPLVMPDPKNIVAIDVAGASVSGILELIIKDDKVVHLHADARTALSKSWSDSEVKRSMSELSNDLKSEIAVYLRVRGEPVVASVRIPKQKSLIQII